MTVFQIDCTILQSYQQYIRVPFSPHSCQDMSILILATPVGVKCISFCFASLMISDVEHLFRYLLGICISSLEKCLFKFITHFKLFLFCILIFELQLFFSMLLVQVLYHIYNLKIFSFCECLVTCLILSFEAQKLLILMKSSLFFLLLSLLLV